MVIYHKELSLPRITNTHLIPAVIINVVNVAIIQKRQAGDTWEKKYTKKFHQLKKIIMASKCNEN